MEKINLVLINPDYMLYSNPPLGLAYLAAYLKKNCDFVDITILDQIDEKGILNQLKKINPDLIGLNAVSLNFLKVKELAAKIKEQNKGLLVLGGIHLTNSPSSFDNSPFDLGIIGEGEKTFSLFLGNFYKNEKKLDAKSLKKIKGLLIRDNNKVLNTGLPDLIENLDEIPLPARELLNMKYYMLPSLLSGGDDFNSMGSMLTSRGCPYNCPFCSSTTFWKKRIRFFSAQRVMEDILVLYNKYHYNKIFVYDDLFSINKPRLRQIIELMEKEGILGKIEFNVYGRADIFDDETAKLLKKMNVSRVIFGFESGSQKMLDYLKCKRVKIEDNIRAINICKENGLSPGGFFMIGSPNETEEDIKQTHDFIKEYCPNAIVYQTIPFPGTQIWDYAVKNKIIEKDFYDHKQKDWIDIDVNFLLTNKISKEKFAEWFYKIRGIYVPSARNGFFKKLSKIQMRNISGFLSPMFIKKAIVLKDPFIKRVFVKKNNQ